MRQTKNVKLITRLWRGRTNSPLHLRLYYRFGLHHLERKRRERRRVLLRVFGMSGYLRLVYARLLRHTHCKIGAKGFERSFFIRPGDSDADVIVQVYDQNEVYPPIKPKVNAILDAGANIGITARYLLDAFPGARLVAIEPDGENCELFRKNVTDSQVVLLRAGLWDCNEPLQISNPSSRSWTYQMKVADSEGRDDVVEGITLEAALHAGNMDHFDVIKIDIEGAEERIFVDEWRHIFAQASLIFVESHGAEIAEGIEKYLQSLGFLITEQGDMTVGYRNPSEFQPSVQDVCCEREIKAL